MSEIRDKARKKMEATILQNIQGESYLIEVTDIIDLILPIPELAIVDREAELPCCFGDPIEFNKALVKAGWVKEVKDG